MPRAYQIPVPSEPTVVHLPTPRIKILPGLHRPFIPLFESVIAKPRLVLVLQVLLGSLEIMLIHTVLDLAIVAFVRLRFPAQAAAGVRSIFAEVGLSYSALPRRRVTSRIFEAEISIPRDRATASARLNELLSHPSPATSISQALVQRPTRPTKPGRSLFLITYRLTTRTLPNRVRMVSVRIPREPSIG